MARRVLLSVDGGGIRGIIPVCALMKLEERTNRLARETFSFVAGTSTGAILCAAVAAGIPAPRLLEMYLERGREIFSPRPPWNTIKRVVRGFMYSTRTLHRVLAEAFGEAGAWKLNDSPIDLLLTAKGLDGTPWYFVKDKPANSGLTGKLGLVDCATASAAAPTYFNPWRFDGAPEFGTLVDGGVGVTGNPVYQACVEAFCYTGEYAPENTTVVSLGTGSFHKAIREPRTLWGWIAWVLTELLRAPEEQQSEAARRQFPQARFFRFDADIPAKPIAMDDVGAVDKLCAYGHAFAESIDWEEVLEDCSLPVAR
ncbi:MAG TPA: patatin-like phospholipase family protein [Bryobacteraceae bacterium]|nr:patatin-like phospholipase family protein [Bryobacteraceae bacterium]